MSNPFTISFGRQPAQFISRPVETNEIIENFEQEPPSSQVYMLTGVRGSGKTVLMTDIAKELAKRENWLVVELSTERDMLTSLAAKLCSRPELFALFVEAKLNFSLLGIGISYALIPIINAVLHHYTGDIPLSAALNPMAALRLVILSVILTIIGGLIPARKASKRDPVEALRSE